MPATAFAVPPVLRVSFVSSRCLRERTVRPSAWVVPKRLRVSCGNLYPEVDPPEHIDNPLDADKEAKETSEAKEANDAKEALYRKLNDRVNQKQEIEVVATDLDASNQSAEATASTPPSPVTAPSAASKVVKPNYARAARALWRVGWATWWVQLILSVISGVILLFSFAFPGVNVRTSASAFGFILSGVGVFIAFVSLFWTYSYTRLSLWLDGATGTLEQARSRINGKLRIGLVFAIVGLIISLTGLQAIVGTLLARLFSAGIATTPYTAYQTGPPGAGGLVAGTGVVQPVDVLVVQACANAMMALLAALTTTVWLQSREKKWNEEAKA